MKRYRKPNVELGNVGKPKLTKIQTGVFQLETAIQLWFLRGDVASITTLTYSGHEIIFRLSRALPKRVQSIAEPPSHPLPNDDEWRTVFKFDYDFCKHAGSDPLEVHYFSVDVLPIVLFDATNLYGALEFGRRLYFYILRLWVMTTLPHIFKNTLEEKGFDPEYVKDCIRMGRGEYFKMAFDQYANTSAGALPWSPVVHAPVPKAGA